MNPYLKNVNKVEFVLTYACTGRCRHCSEGDHASSGERLDPEVAAHAVRKIASRYPLETVMTFGGEPLLCVQAVEAVMRAASELGIARRQVITNGYFTKDRASMCAMAERLERCGVNDLVVSVDAFHQQTIPVEIVRAFVCEALACGIPVRLSPAWLVSATNDNPYNQRTRELLASFRDLPVVFGEGNVIFPEGNAVKYLAEYFAADAPENPYVDDPYDVRCISFAPNGDVLGDNVYRRDILDILEAYAPEKKQ